MSTLYTRSLAEAVSTPAEFNQGDPLARADTDMKFVLDALVNLEGRPIEQCSAREARRQPLPSTAVAKLLANQDKDPRDDQGVDSETVVIPGPAGEIPARVYRSRSMDADTTPALLLYIHGGGWVVSDLDSQDAIPRALARKTGAIVVSTHYRQAPEHKFPAAHEDTYAAWLWLIENAAELGGDPVRAAVAGEGVGGNMAANIALQARDEMVVQPVHVVLICPLAGNDAMLPSYSETIGARPLSPALLRWFKRQAFQTKADGADRRIALAERDDLTGLPPTTLILAEIDPLRSEGEALGQALQDAGVWVDMTTYHGVTHEFFGLGQFVNKAMFAQTQVANNLVEAFTSRNHKI
jgi:acetyl esterase